MRCDGVLMALGRRDAGAMIGQAVRCEPREAFVEADNASPAAGRRILLRYKRVMTAVPSPSGIDLMVLKGCAATACSWRLAAETPEP
jgi:hypothetical protein